MRFQFCCLNQRPTTSSCKSSVFNSPEEDRMRKAFCRLMLVLLAFCLLTAPCLGNGAAEILKRQERGTISLELEFAKKNPNALQRVISFLNWGPNGYATGLSWRPRSMSVAVRQRCSRSIRKPTWHCWKFAARLNNSSRRLFKRPSPKMRS